MVYAIFSLGFAGVNDVVFKKYGQRRRSVGLLLAIAGLVWTLFFLGLGLAKNTLEFEVSSVLIGSVSGLFSAFANILLVEAMKKTGASVASTIYRLNLVFVAILAFLFLDESIGMLKVLGLLAAIVAVFLFSIRRDAVEQNDLAVKFLLLLVLASFLRACMGISYKLASSFCSNDEVFLAINGIWWMIAGCSYFLLRERSIPFTMSALKYSLLSGLLICGIVLFLKLAVNKMDASIAVSISQFSFLVTAPLTAFFMDEQITVLKGLGMLLAALCVTLFFFAK